MPIKQKIGKAKAAVSALPDVGRSVEEQEAEIKRLEERCERLRDKVGELAALAGSKFDGSNREEEAMEGIEGGT